MDEYVLLSKKAVAEQTGAGRHQPPSSATQYLSGQQPPDSKDVLTLNSLVERILSRKDITDYEKSDLLSSALQRYQAWSSQEHTQSKEKIISHDQLLPKAIANVSAPMRSMKRYHPPNDPPTAIKRSADDDSFKDKADKMPREATVKTVQRRPPPKTLRRFRGIEKPYYVSDDMDVVTGETKRKLHSKDSHGPVKRRLKQLKRGIERPYFRSSDNDDDGDSMRNQKRIKWISLP